MEKWVHMNITQEMGINREYEEVFTEKPKGLSYAGVSRYGIHYYRKSDKTNWIETTQMTKDKKEIRTIWVRA